MGAVKKGTQFGDRQMDKQAELPQQTTAVRKCYGEVANFPVTSRKHVGDFPVTLASGKLRGNCVCGIWL